jgi:hypothetical protein
MLISFARYFQLSLLKGKDLDGGGGVLSSLKLLNQAKQSIGAKVLKWSDDRDQKIPFHPAVFITHAL